MTVKIDDLRLWNAQKSTVANKGNISKINAPGTDSDENFLVGLTAQQELRYDGIVSGVRLSSDSSYPDNPLVALSEWILQYETYLNGDVKGNVTLTDTSRDRDFRVTPTSLSWDYEGGAGFRVNYGFEAIWASSFDSIDRNTPPNTSVSDTWSLDGVELGKVLSYRHTKKENIENYAIAYADPGENEAVQTSGTIREIYITGRTAETGKIDQLDSQLFPKSDKTPLLYLMSPSPDED